ncbi:hypothetical protein ACFCV8_07905 [Streptomyces sp. NPDC056347]|uniref:hypothetical protein n=1 Tax=Streptomyces sp. NPDC056347 TaxID=3345790 RepID=UPI0035D9CFA8
MHTKPSEDLRDQELTELGRYFTPGEAVRARALATQLGTFLLHQHAKRLRKLSARFSDRPRKAAALKIWLASLSKERQGSFAELAAFEAAALVLPANVDSAHWYSGWKILQDYPGSTPDSLCAQASELEGLYAQAVLRRSKGAQTGEQALEGEASVTERMPGRRGSRSASRPVTTLATYEPAGR